MKAVTSFLKRSVKTQNVGGPILNIESFNFDWIGATSALMPFDVNLLWKPMSISKILIVIYSYNMKLAYVRSYEGIQLKEVNGPF